MADDSKAFRNMSRTLMAGFILALLVAAVLRFPQLGARPMHNDEGVNAIKLRGLWEHGTYQYDPQEYHGPTLPYASWASMKLIGAKNYVDFTEAQLRTVTVWFGIGLILLLPLIADGLGKRAVVCAALLTAISPAMTFYSRYYIHEMLLVFFTFLALASGWRYWRSGKLAWALLIGAAIGLMQSTKETFVLALAAMVAAFVANAWLNRLYFIGPRSLDSESAASRGGSQSEECGRCFNPKHIIGAVAIWLVVVIVLFSSFFTNASGPLDAVRTYMPWLHRAGGASPHIHPFGFYFDRLVWFQEKSGPIWSEALILALALIGIVAAFQRKRLSEGCAGFVRFLAIYTILLAIIYSVIRYKTPWCLLNFWQTMILLAGVGVVTLMRWLKKREFQIATGVILFAAAGQLALQAWRADVPYAADPRNPYVYAQTSSDVTNLVALVDALAKVSPQKHGMLIKVMAPENDYGPLPWYLRDFTRVGWWSEVPQDPYAPVMIVSVKLDAKLDEKGTHLQAGIFKLRPETFFEVYVEEGLWRTYVATKPREE